MTSAERISRLLLERAREVAVSLPQFIPLGTALFCVSCEGFYSGTQKCPKCGKENNHRPDSWIGRVA